MSISQSKQVLQASYSPSFALSALSFVFWHHVDIYSQRMWFKVKQLQNEDDILLGYSVM
jgi:hypothetical protein